MSRPRSLRGARVAAFVILVAMTATLAIRSSDSRTERNRATITTATGTVLGREAGPPAVLISEILAINRGGLTDEDGDTPGWIEIHNAGATTISLAGWTLTDDRRHWDKWTFPDVELAPNERRIVLASGKNRRDPEADLHTNFRLNDEGEYLGLFGADGTASPENVFFPRYPQQQANVAFARIDGQLRYAIPPTAGEASTNVETFSGLVSNVEFSHERGLYRQAFSLRLRTSTDDTQIRYTLDGSEPDQDNGIDYTRSIRINDTTVVRAAAFRSGWVSSSRQMHTYVYPDSVPKQSPPTTYPERWGEGLPADYGIDPTIANHESYGPQLASALMSLPTLSIAMHPDDLFGVERGIYLSTEMDGLESERAAQIDYRDAARDDSFSAAAGIRVQGRSSRKPMASPKHSFRLLFKGEYGPGAIDFPFDGGESEARVNTLVLRATSNYSWTFPLAAQRERATYTREAWAQDTMRAMGHSSPRGRFVHLYLNGLYWGIYLATERPDAAFMAAHFGGREEDYDVIKGAEVVDGDDRAWRLVLNTVASDTTDPEVYKQINALVDLENFVDYMILNHYAGNENWDYGNWYTARRRTDGEKFQFFLWDMESILGRESESRIYVRHRDRPSEVFHRLLRNEDFRDLCAERIRLHLTGDGALTPTRASKGMDKFLRSIEPAIVAESVRWGDYRLTVHPYRTEPFQRYTPAHWQLERDRLLQNYFPARSDIVLEQYRRAGLAE